MTVGSRSRASYEFRLAAADFLKAIQPTDGAFHLVCDMLDGSPGVPLFAPFWSGMSRFAIRLGDDVDFPHLVHSAGRRKLLLTLLAETVIVSLPLVLAAYAYSLVS